MGKKTDCGFGKAWPVFLAALLTFVATARPSPAALRLAIAGIRHQERLLRNIQVTALATSVLWSRKVQAMRAAGATNLMMTLENIPAGRFRVNVTKEVDRAVGGPSPYYVQSYEGAFDGRIAKMFTSRSGALGHPLINPHAGMIWGKAPRELTMLRGGVGWTATIFGVPLEINPPVGGHHASCPPLSHLLATPWGKWSTQCAIVRGQGGKEWYELSRYFPRGRFVLRLDPRKGFSMVRLTQFYWHVDPKHLPKRGTFPPLLKHPARVVVASRFLEPVPGVFYPQRIVETVYGLILPHPGPIAINTVKVLRVLVNQPAAKLGNYRIAFPLGTRVTDGSTGQVIHIGGTPQQQMKEINKAVTAAATQPARNGGAK